MTNQRVSLLVGLAAIATVGGALPASAATAESQILEVAPDTEATTVAPGFSLDLTATNLKQPKSMDTLLVQALPPEAVEEAATPAIADSMADAIPAASVTTVSEVADDPSVSTTADVLLAPETPEVVDEAMLTAFNTTDIDTALNSSVVEAGADFGSGTELAQLTRTAYQGVSPAYLGVGGNLGIGDPNSATADFGFAVISKISLGPRFSLRPSAIISERDVSFPIPLTYNFNMTRLGGVRFQPYVGAGVDVSDNVALLLDAGIDVPISRDFTINATTNWRVTSGFGFGMVIGVGYNFPFIFE